MGASPSSWGCQWSWTPHSNMSAPTGRLTAQLLPHCSAGLQCLWTVHTAAATASSLCASTCNMHAWLPDIRNGNLYRCVVDEIGTMVVRVYTRFQP